MKRPNVRSNDRSIKPNSFAEVIRAYLASPKFNMLQRATQASYRQYLKIAELPNVLGALPIGVIRPALVQGWCDSRRDGSGFVSCGDKQADGPDIGHRRAA